MKTAWPSNRAEAAPAGVAVLLALFVAAVPLYFSLEIYYFDDVQHQYLPAFVEIGRRLGGGEWPLISTKSWYGGFWIAEYQYALLNPVSLALYWVLSAIEQFWAATVLFVGFHLALLTLGTYWLARTLHIPPGFAALAALAMGSNTFVHHWFAIAWWPGLVSLAWFPWAAAALLRCRESRGAMLWAAFFCYQVLVSGWPQTTVALAVAVALACAAEWLSARSVRRVLSIAVPALAAALLAAPALVPLLIEPEFYWRPGSTLNNAFHVPTLGSLLHFAFPGHTPFMKSFGGWSAIDVPTFYAAWFGLVFVLWRGRWPDGERFAGWWLAGVVGVFALLACGPEHLGPLRWPMRWIPFFHLGLVLAAARLLAAPELLDASPRRIALLAAVLALLWVTSWQETPHRSVELLTYLALVGVPVLGLAALQGAQPRATAWFCIAATVALLVVCRAHWPQNPAFADWHAPRTATEARERFGGEGNTWHAIVGELTQNRARFDELATGNFAFAAGAPVVNGYSPREPRALKELLCFNTFSWSGCGPEGMLAVDPLTGRPTYELFKLERIMLEPRAWFAAGVRASLEGTWRLEHQGRWAERWRRTGDAPRLPGSLAWSSSSTTTLQLVREGEQEAVWKVSASPGAATRLVFARHAYPGYRAHLDGEALPVGSHRGMFLSVTLPPGRSGELVLRYGLPGLPWIIACVLLGAALLAGWRYASSQWQARALDAPTAKPPSTSASE